MILYTLTAPAVYAARLHGYLICAWLQVVTDVVEPWQEGE